MIPIEQWSENLKTAPGEIGEIVVKGENVTRAYFNRDEANRLAKIRDGEHIRHRMGDLGYFDEAGKPLVLRAKSASGKVNRQGIVYHPM
jgi:acyl-CoA synthetase (AMP-forming)/AMP-acid ligase II